MLPGAQRACHPKLTWHLRIYYQVNALENMAGQLTWWTSFMALDPIHDTTHAHFQLVSPGKPGMPGPSIIIIIGFPGGPPGGGPPGPPNRPPNLKHEVT
jgi:hypothetical protein